MEGVLSGRLGTGMIADHNLVADVIITGAGGRVRYALLDECIALS